MTRSTAAAAATLAAFLTAALVAHAISAARDCRRFFGHGHPRPRHLLDLSGVGEAEL